MPIPVADQQILRGATATLSWQYLDAAGEPTDPGTVTVGVNRADGTVLVAAGQPTVASGTARTFALTAVQTAQLDLLAVTWTRTGGDGGTYPTVAEIVGGYYFTVAQARASDPALNSDTKYPDGDLQQVRAEIEADCEDIPEVAFVPRYRRQRLDGTGTNGLVLPIAMPRRIVAVHQVAADGSTTAWTAGEVAAIRVDDSGEIISPLRSFPWGTANVIVAWEHGHDRPPKPVKDAALLLLRHRAVRPFTAVPDRAQTFQIEGGSVYRLDQADKRSTGIADVDAVLDRYSMATHGTA